MDIDRPDRDAQAPAPSQPADGGDDLDRLLDEFDKTASKPAPATNGKAGPEQAKPEAPIDPIEVMRREAGDDALGYANRLVEKVNAERHAEKTAQQNREDFERVFASARDVTAEFDVPEVYGALWIEALYARDPELQQMISERYSSPQALDRAERAVTRVLKGLREHCKTLPDRNATEDREAVTFSVRTAGLYKPAPSAAPNYSAMSDREFSDSVERDFKFRPGRLG